MSYYHKYPEEVKMETVERVLNQQEGRFIIKPGFFFVGTFNNHYSWDIEKGHEFVGANINIQNRENVDEI